MAFPRMIKTQHKGQLNTEEENVMIVKTIRSRSNDNLVSPPFCMVAIYGSKIYLVRQDPYTGKMVMTSWEELKHQVKRAERQYGL